MLSDEMSERTTTGMDHWHRPKSTVAVANKNRHPCIMTAETSFSVAAGNHDLRTGAEAECHGEDTDVQQAAHSRSSQFHFAYMSQEGGIGYVNDILCQQCQ